MAGYGNDSACEGCGAAFLLTMEWVGWAVGHSYSDHPVFQPYIYDPNAPAGSKFSSSGLSPATIPRLYHSTALLLVDGENIHSLIEVV